jgi:hypothetical protein
VLAFDVHHDCAILIEKSHASDGTRTAD